MAFEALLQSTTSRPRSARRLTYAVSLVAHVAALVGGVAYSFWHVDELVPPAVAVTFVSGATLAALPPPPADPIGGDVDAPAPPAGARRKIAARPKIEAPQKPEVVLPPKIEVKPATERQVAATVDPKPEAPAPPAGTSVDKAAIGGPGTRSGVVGGQPGGSPSGPLGASGIAAATPPKLLPPQMGALRKISGAEPRFPPGLYRAGVVDVVMAKVCVNKAGVVENVAIIKGSQPSLNANVVSAVKTWRYNPLLANGIAVPFCYVARLEFTD